MRSIDGVGTLRGGSKGSERKGVVSLPKISAKKLFWHREATSYGALT